jgi:hypothetical protein
MSHDHEHDHHHGDHEHGHDHHAAAGVEGTWADPEQKDPLSVSRRGFLATAAVAAGAVAGLGSAAAGLGQGVAAAAYGQTVNPWTRNTRFLAGDHHVHTQFSPDAQYEVETQVSKAVEYGLDWVVITDHGGTAHQKFSIDQVTPRVEASRRAHGGMLVYQGLEWNIPGGEHATVMLPPGYASIDILRAFEGGFDGAVLADQGKVPSATSGEGETYALQALKYLEGQVRNRRTELALMFANHPSRRGLDSPHEMRAWREAAPSVAVGMEGAPGHQAAGIPLTAGGPGKARGYYDFAPQPDSFPGYAPTATENFYRTYGGFDFATAKVGGLWDSLLAEGLPWWVTSTSDSHQVFGDTRIPGTQDHNATGSRGAPIDTGSPITTYGDFWPGQYSATLAASGARTYVGVMRALQAGKIVAVHGRLIEGLDVRVRAPHNGDLQGATLGGRTWVRRGNDIEVFVTVTLPTRPNASGEVPRLAKMDLISGPVTGPVIDRDTLTAPRTTVAETFEIPRTGNTVSFKHTFRNVQESFYVRFRGTDGKQLDSAGNPLQDVVGDADPWADLWFYANPVFVEVS